MSAEPRLQRSEGALRIGFRHDGSVTRLGDLFQSGCLKARFPRCFGTEPREAVLINTAGGLTDGDRLGIDVRWQDGSTAVVASQAAERIYRCRATPARVSTSLAVRDAAIAGWLPQETIVFDGSRLDRDTRIEVSGSGRFFGVESFVFGRTAMGETLRTGSIIDRWRVYRDGSLVFADTLALGGIDSPGDLLNRPAVTAGLACTATAVYVAGDCGDLLEELRSALAAEPAETGVSELEGLLVVRIVAGDSRIMRRLIIRSFEVCLADAGFGEPRVWRC